MTNQTTTLEVALGPALTEPQAREIYRQGEEAVVFALLSLAQRVADPQALADVRRYSHDALGDDPALSQAQGRSATQTPRSQGRTSRLPAADARAELKTVDKYGRLGPNWPAFAKKLRRLPGDAIRLKKRDDVPAEEEEYASRRARLTGRLDGLIAVDREDKDAKPMR